IECSLQCLSQAPKHHLDPGQQGIPMARRLPPPIMGLMWWLGDWIRLILHQLPLPRKEPERGKNYFGLYLLAGGLKPYDMESDIETATALTKTMEVSNHTALAKTFYTPLRQHSVLSGQRLPSKFTQLPSKAPDQAITGKKYFVLYLRWLGEGNFLVQIIM